MKNRRQGMQHTGDNEWFARLALGAATIGGLLPVFPAPWMALTAGAALLAAWVWLAEPRLAYRERVILRNLLIVILGIAIAVGLSLRQAQEQQEEAAQEARQ